MSEIPFRLPDRASGRTETVTSVFLPALKEALLRRWHRLQCSWRYSASLRELHALDARTLKDVGLHRGDFHAIAYSTARQGAFGRFGAVRVRRVEIADLPRCVQFGRLLHPEDVRRRFGRLAALGDGDTFRRLFRLDDGKIETVGALDVSGRLLGLATIAWITPGSAEIALIVRSDLQRRGIGATLLANVIKNARGAGFHMLVAHIETGNVPMQRLARRFGFELAGNGAAPIEAQLVLDGRC